MHRSYGLRADLMIMSNPRTSTITNSNCHQQHMEWMLSWVSLTSWPWKLEERKEHLYRQLRGCSQGIPLNPSRFGGLELATTELAASGNHGL